MIFVNYQKMKRKFETTVSSAMSQGLVNTSVRYQYDAMGNPVIVSMNSGTQTLQSAYILRDQYNRTSRIQYYGYLNGFFDRKLEENNYNIVYENLNVYEYNMRISDIVSRIVGKQGLFVVDLTNNLAELTDIIGSYTDDNVDMYLVANLPLELSDSYPYQILIDDAHRTNKKVATYIDTDFTDRSQTEIEDIIKQLLDNYPMLDGFYFDNVPTEYSYYQYYQQLTNFIRNIKTHYDIIFNCKNIPDVFYFTASDYVVVYDGDSINIPYEDLEKLTDEQKIQSIVLVNDCLKEEMKELVYKITSRYIYFTDSEDYSSVSSYLDSEILELVHKFKRIDI